MDLGSVNKRSPRDLAIGAVVFSCMGGFELGRGIQGLVFTKLLYVWTAEFLFGTAFLAYGIFWAVMLLRRVGSVTQEVLPPSNGSVTDPA